LCIAVVAALSADEQRPRAPIRRHQGPKIDGACYPSVRYVAGFERSLSREVVG